MEPQLSLFPNFQREVAQHNNLIFAPFALGSLENRIFIAMLERTDRHCGYFTEHRIPIKEVLKRRDGDSYEQLRKVAATITSVSFDLASVDDRSKMHRKGFKYRNLISKCDHEVGSGYLVCKFSDDVLEFLVKLVGRYTKADTTVLKTFKDEKSVRFYWMLKSRFYNSDTAEISVEECRQTLLKDSTKYSNPSELKLHIIEKVIKPEIDTTDCAFEFDTPVKKGNKTLAWVFKKKVGGVTVIQQQPINLSQALQELLTNKPISIDAKGLQKINDIIGTETSNGILISEDYILRVIQDVLKLNTVKPIKSLGGYILNCVSKGYIFKEDQKLVYKSKVKSDESENKLTVINEERAVEMYKAALAIGETKYPFAGYVRVLKLKNIVVEGFSY